MKCTFKCHEGRNPVIGIANLQGRPGYPTAGCSGQYPLCAYHYQEAVGGNWSSVTLVGWEAFPTIPTSEPPARAATVQVEESDELAAQ